MRNPRFHLDRRDFLKRAAALGASAAAPIGLLGACGGSDDDSSDADARELHDLHFDFSNSSVVEPRLFALRSLSHNSPIQTHDAASRARHRELNPALASVADAQLTHYVEQVDLPAKALQGVMVMGRHPTSGQPVLAAAQVFVPNSARRSVAQRAADSRVTRLSAKRQHYGLSAQRAASNPAAAAAPNDDIRNLVTAWDVATYLVFHHPEVMNLNADLGAEILDRIESLPCDPSDTSCIPVLGNLAFKLAELISTNGYPSTTPGSWATLVPIVGLSGKPALDANGEPIYRYDITDEIAQSTSEVVKVILKSIFNDPLFKDTNWHPTSGIATHGADAAAAAAGTAAVTARRSATSTGFGVEATQPVGSTISGIRMVDLAVADASSRQVQLTIKNDYLRFLGVYVQYRNSDTTDSADGKLLPIVKKNDLDTDRSYFVDMAPSNVQIMGIPLQGNDVMSSTLTFTMPAEATSATLMFGSLGLGGEYSSKEAQAGSALTMAINIGLPAMFLAMGVLADVTLGGSMASLSTMNGGSFLQEAAIAIIRGLAGSSEFAAGVYGGSSNNCQAWISAAANVAIQALFDFAPTMAAQFAAEALEGAALDAFTAALGPVGIALKALAALATAAAIAVCLGESFASPAISTNKISLTMDTTVRLARDPRDFQFPASARRWEALAYYDGGAVPRKASGTMTQGQVDPIDIVFSGVPSGGNVKFVVSLYSDDGCLVGIAQSEQIANLPATASLVPLPITELLAALNANTQYQHSLRLAYADGAHRWLEAPASLQTLSSLCAGTDTAVCNLTGLTVHTASGMAGYGYSAGGQSLCGGGSGVGYTARNIFLGANAESGVKKLPCGYSQPVGVLYDPIGPIAGGRHFYVEPAADGNHLRQVTLDTGTPLASSTLSWGRFNNALDSLAVLPSGYVVGVNRQTHKMEVLQLGSTPVDQSQEAQAVPFATQKCGQGTRAGLLDTPVAVASYGGAVLVLEQGNARVQALDAHGNPVNLFAQGTSNLMALQPEAGVVYLDLAVEGQGYMYVLSYEGNGTQVSQYRLDLYTPDGQFLSRTQSVTAARLAVDLFRNVYTLNYETLTGAPLPEPSLSQWLPHTPGACPAPPAASSAGFGGMARACGNAALAA